VWCDIEGQETDCRVDGLFERASQNVVLFHLKDIFLFFCFNGSLHFKNIIAHLT